MGRLETLEWNLQQAQKDFGESMTEGNLERLIKSVEAVEDFHRAELKKYLRLQEELENFKSSLSHISNVLSGRIILEEDRTPKKSFGKLGEKLPQQLRQASIQG